MNYNHKFYLQIGLSNRNSTQLYPTPFGMTKGI